MREGGRRASLDTIGFNTFVKADMDGEHVFNTLI